MTETLDVLVSRECPGKSAAHFNLTWGIFGRQCVYINSRCLVPESYPIKDCIIYMQHNKVKPILTEKDVHETNMGIGACDEYGARQYNGR